MTTAARHPLPGVLAITGGRVVPVADPPIERGTVLIKDGRIIAVGPADRVEIPASTLASAPCALASTATSPSGREARSTR
jgi:imidazolonepropionase-like amidohydrolase